MIAVSPRDALTGLWRLAEQPGDALSSIEFTGAEPALPSSFAIGTAAQASIAASALAANELWQLRTGRRQQVSVAMRDAAIEFRSERYMRVDGTPVGESWDKIAGLYRTGDGRFVRIHTNFPHHRDGMLKLLGCDYERAAVQRALDGWEAQKFETAAAEAGLVATATRSFAEWDAHPQGQAVASLPVLTIERIGDGPPQPLAKDGKRPLSGVKVLDLTRVIAGPVCGRTLAVHGADVMLMTGRHLPSIPPLVVDSGRGKLSASIDLRNTEGRNTLKALLRDADIFVQGYRPGAIASHEFGAEAAAAIRPGVVYVTLSAYGHTGPWANRRGFDSLVQNANGLNIAEAEAFGAKEPKPLPAQVIDHASGYLLAFGAMIALARRVTEGGSWHVRVSLAQTGQWFRGLGRIDGTRAPDPELADVIDRIEASNSGFGKLTAVRHSVAMSETPPHWDRPSVPLGTHAPAWP
jgi:crotonobetainyl-CoA:carnitine CoA-transferase CaiB-like acyl-CoA transferase